MPACFKKAFVGKRRYISLSILCLLGLLVLYFLTGVVVHASGITEELQGTSSYEYARLASSYYQLDYYYDAGFLGGLTEGVFYVFHGLTKLIWGLVLIFTYFVISIVREAYSLDIFTTFSTMITTFIQRVVGVDSAGVKNNGLLYGFLFLVILVVAVYMAYQGFAKKSGSKAFGALSNMFIMFIVTVVFIGFAPTLLTNITSFSKEVNTMVLSAGTNTFTSGEVTAEESPEYLSDSLWQVLVKNPWLILEFGSTDVEQSRVDAILANDKDTDARQEVVKNDEVGTRENKVMSADGLWDRLGNSFLILLVDLIVCYFVLMLVVTMLMYDFLFLLYVAMSPFVLVFSMFPNNGNSFTRYVMKLFNTLMAKAVVLFLMTLAFSLSTMVYQQFSDKSFLFIAFLQIVIYLSVYMNLHKLTALAGIRSKDGTEGVSTVDRKVNRGLRNAGRTAGAFIAGNTVGRISNAMKEKKRNKDNDKPKENQPPKQATPKTRKQNLPISDSNLSSENKAFDVMADDLTLAKNQKQRSQKIDENKKDDSKKNSNSKSAKTKEDSENRKKQLETLKQRRNAGANVKKRNPSIQSREASVQDSINKNNSATSLKQPTNEKARNTEVKQPSVRNTTSSTRKNTKTVSPQVNRQSKIHEKVVYSSSAPKQRTVQGVK